MKYNPDIYHRHSIRLKDFDYSGAGYYYVTICVKEKLPLFGIAENGKMILNEVGQVVEDSWKWLGNQYEYVSLDEYIVIPNHMHGIIIIDGICRGGSRTAPTVRRKPLGRLVGAFKTVSTKKINQLNNTAGEYVWQRNYYEHVIRNENDLNNIREYIVNNPVKWVDDEYNIKKIRAVHEPPLRNTITK